MRTLSTIQYFYSRGKTGRPGKRLRVVLEILEGQIDAVDSEILLTRLQYHNDGGSSTERGGLD